MNLTGIRRALGASRRAVRVRMFGNNQPFSVNLRNRRYLAEARKIWRARGERPLSASAGQWARQLGEQGYVQIAPSPEQAALYEGLQQRADRDFATPALCTSPIDGAVRLKDGIGRLPEICDVFTPDIVQAVESYLQSHFKIYWVQVYRTMPSEKAPEKSFLWHVDNCPQEVVKLMVYLTDTWENTGAFRLKPRPLSRSMISRGFWDRAQNVRFEGELKDGATTRVFEGAKGTRILFLNWGCIHRAKHPETSHRDVAVFNLIPSTIPWDEHARKHRAELSLRDEDVCADPARY
jgi:hypothetical protein